MGLSDTLVFTDERSAPRCPNGHVLRSFQTKDLDEPSMDTYLVRGDRLYRTTPRNDEDERWRFEGNQAIREHWFDLEPIQASQPIHVYASCYECEPVLVRNDHSLSMSDIVGEHSLFVDFALTFRPDQPIEIRRTSGTREDLREDLRKRGLYVLADDEPLAIAHRQVKASRERSDEHEGRPARGRRWRGLF